LAARKRNKKLAASSYSEKNSFTRHFLRLGGVIARPLVFFCIFSRQAHP
jgi:hypothetical protein